MDPKIQAGLADLALKLSSNEKTRRPFTKLVREVAPNIRFQDQELEDFKQAEAERREAEKLAAETARINRQLEKQRKSLLASHTEDQVKEIESLMTEHGISNYDIGAKLYNADRSPAMQSGREPSRRDARWELPKIEGLFADPAKTALNLAYQEIDRIRSRR